MTQENLCSGFPDKVRLKPVCAATESSYKIEILLVVSLDMILSKKWITKVLIRVRKCAGWSAPLLFANPEDMFYPVEACIISQLSQSAG